MPVPRRSVTASTTPKRKTTRKKRPATTGGRARKGERLLITCTPLVTTYMLEDLAQTLHGAFLTGPDGGYYQVMAVRIDEKARKIFGRCQEMYEAAPYMFAPVP